AEEAERGLEQDRRPDDEGPDREHRRYRVRHDLAEEDRPLADAEAAHRVDEIELLHPHDLAAHDPRRLRPGEEGDDVVDLPEAGPGEWGNNRGEDEARHDLKNLGDTHDEEVEPAAVETGHGTDAAAEQRRRGGGEEADGERHLNPVDDARCDVAA